MGIVAGVRNRRSILTKASVTFPVSGHASNRNARLGDSMANGSREGLACANTNNSRRLRVSPRKDNCCKTSPVATVKVPLSQSCFDHLGRMNGYKPLGISINLGSNVARQGPENQPF